MTPVSHAMIPALWIAWTAYWLFPRASFKPVRRQEGLASRLSHILPLLLAAWLIWAPPPPGSPLSGRILPAGAATYWSGVAILAVGFAIAIWARIHLGGNWSSIVTLKREHELIRSGPYGIVRHPIYTGLLMAFLGTAIAVRGDWRGLLAVALIFAALWRKLGIEERFLGESFGAEYARYRAEVPALIPFLL